VSVWTILISLRLVAGVCEDGNVSSGCVTSGEFLDQFNDSVLL